MRSQAFEDSGLQDYSNKEDVNIEVQVVQSYSESDSDTADYDGNIMSELISTSQAAESNNTENVCVLVMENVGDFIGKNEIFYDNAVERKQTIEEIKSMPLNSAAEEKHVIEEIKSTPASEEKQVTEDVKNISNNLTEKIVTELKKKYDLKEKIKMSTIGVFDELKTDVAMDTVIQSSEGLRNGASDDLLVTKRGRPKKVKVESEVKEVKKKGDRPGHSKRKKRKNNTNPDSEPAVINESTDCDTELNIKKETEEPKHKPKPRPTMQEFKSKLETWAEENKTKPEVFRESVHYGNFLKPIINPGDLNSDFFSAACNGYYCINCSLLFKNRCKFIKHRFNTDGRCYYECDVCNKRFMVRSEMLSHRKYHSKDRPFTCQQCNQSYSRRHTLNLHIQQNHQHNSPYMCYICGKLFKIRPCLLRHLKYAHIEENEKMALCSQCPKRFKSEHDLKAHARTHVMEKQFPCDICSKPFKTKKYMKEHRKIHSQERVQVCEVCGKGFFKLEHLKNHSLLHSGLKPYACTFCSYRCTVKCNLVKHLKTHNKCR